MTKFKEHLNPEKENLEEAVMGSSGAQTQMAWKVSFGRLDGLLVQFDNGYFIVDLMPDQIKQLAKGKAVRQVPVSFKIK